MKLSIIIPCYNEKRTILEIARKVLAVEIPADKELIVVDDLGIRDHFDLLMSGTNLPESKPNPAIYLQTAAYLRVDPRDCVVVEDAANGARAAKAAGMTCIGYRAPGSIQDLSICDVVVEKIQDIDLTQFFDA